MIAAAAGLAYQEYARGDEGALDAAVDPILSKQPEGEI
jgi:hypothetical protein